MFNAIVILWYGTSFRTLLAFYLLSFFLGVFNLFMQDYLFAGFFAVAFVVLLVACVVKLNQNMRNADKGVWD